MRSILVDMSLCIEVSPIIKVTTAAKIKPIPRLHMLPPMPPYSALGRLRVAYTFRLFLGISIHYSRAKGIPEMSMVPVSILLFLNSQSFLQPGGLHEVWPLPTSPTSSHASFSKVWHTCLFSVPEICGVPSGPLLMLFPLPGNLSPPPTPNLSTLLTNKLASPISQLKGKWAA